MTAAKGLGSSCDLLRSLHRPGFPLVLPNAWDAATAKAVAAAGFPAVATTSAGVAAALGYEDHEGAPAGEMLAAAARITRSVGVPVTVDAEAGYAMTAAELVAELRGMGAAGAATLRTPTTRPRRCAIPLSRRHGCVLCAGPHPIRATGLSSTHGSMPSYRLPSRDRAGAPKATWCQRACAARGHISTPVPTACTRSGSGRPVRWRPSSRPARARSTYSASRRPLPGGTRRARGGQGQLRRPAAPRRHGALRPRPRIAGGRAARAPGHRLAHRLGGRPPACRNVLSHAKSVFRGGRHQRDPSSAHTLLPPSLRRSARPGHEKIEKP